MTYNILDGHLNVNGAIFLQEHAWMATRGHSCRLFKQFALKEVRQKYFLHHFSITGFTVSSTEGLQQHVLQLSCEQLELTSQVL